VRAAEKGIQAGIAKVATAAKSTAKAVVDKIRKPQVLRNKAAGDKVADQIAKQYPGAQREVTLQATGGTRRLDILTRTGLAIESKVGRTSLSRETRRQIQRDIELLNDPSSGVTAIEWHFTTSRTTGKGGPTGLLLRELQKAGIGVVIR
jgi:hypothetical protein